jgi:hypothetical protein
MPLLREFDLDLPDDPANRIRFRNETRCITALYERFFGKYKTDKCWKILVKCVTHVKTKQCVDLLGVYTIEVEFHLNNFFELGEHKKKEVALNILYFGIMKLVDQKGWSKLLFAEAYQAVMATRLNNIWRWKKPIRSPSGKKTAIIICHHNVTDFRIYIVVYAQKGNEIINKHIITESPNEFAYSMHLGRLVWDSEHRITLINKNFDNSWSVEVP